MRKAWLIPAFILACAAAASAAAPVSRFNEGSEPAVGVEAEIGTGDVFLASWSRTEVEFARLKSAVKVSDTGMTLPKGMLLEAADDSTPQRPTFCAWQETAHYCLFDTDADRIFDKATISLGARPLPRISGSYVLEYQPAEGSPGWRKELLYQGASEGVARFTFREYGEDWTAPRSSESLSYDLAKEGPSEIVYQGARVQLLGATSNALRYKVIAAFRSPP
jgi:hypothetical protein